MIFLFAESNEFRLTSLNNPFCIGKQACHILNWYVSASEVYWMDMHCHMNGAIGVAIA